MSDGIRHGHIFLPELEQFWVFHMTKLFMYFFFSVCSSYWFKVGGAEKHDVTDQDLGAFESKIC